MATYKEKNPGEDETEVVCPECGASDVFGNDVIRAWEADPETDETFDRPQARPIETFPTHEPCGNTMIPRDELE